MATFTSATTHAVFIPEQWSDETIVSLENNLVMAKLVKQIKFDGGVKGDIIHMPSVSTPVAADITESDTDIVGATPATETDWSLTLNKFKHVTFYIPKHLGNNLSHYELRAPYTAKISYALALIMDTDLFALVQPTTGLTKSAGTTADGLEGNISDDMILYGMEQLDALDVPQEGRALVLPVRQKSKLLKIDKFVRADAIGPDASVIQKALFGDIYGMGVYFTANTPAKALATAPATVADSLIGVMLHEEALAIAIPQNVDIDYAYLPQKKCWILSGDCLYGVKVFRDTNGVGIITKAAG